MYRSCADAAKAVAVNGRKTKKGPKPTISNANFSGGDDKDEEYAPPKRARVEDDDPEAIYDSNGEEIIGMTEMGQTLVHWARCMVIFLLKSFLGREASSEKGSP